MTTTVTTYATPEDVKTILQNTGRFSGFQAFDATSSPTEEEVRQLITSAEDHIDKTTKHAWRTKTITNEMHDIPRWYKYGTGRAIYLKHREVKTFSHAAADKIEIWDGTNWVDYVTDKTEGRNNDYWIDYSNGVIYIMMNLAYMYYEQSVRVTYRYGETTVPEDITHATALIVASLLITSDDKTFMLPETGDPTRMSYDSRTDKWMARAKYILSNYVEL